ncbi:MAG: hypothetical protein HOV79_23660 [Hamadaea sp.]|nr:hypothetical protein [Hamadaea sp.]
MDVLLRTGEKLGVRRLRGARACRCPEARSRELRISRNPVLVQLPRKSHEPVERIAGRASASSIDTSGLNVTAPDTAGSSTRSVTFANHMSSVRFSGTFGRFPIGFRVIRTLLRHNETGQYFYAQRFGREP